MSARHERQWWPISSKNSSSVGAVGAKRNIDPSPSFPSDKPRKQSVGMKFSTITSAMGFKSKRHPTLAIQEPPPDIRPKAVRVDTQAVRCPNRPPAKSVSTVQSWEDSNEPQTPSDLFRDGMPRVLTTSESDLFSSRGIRGSPTIHDPSRLSVYSGSSMPGTLSKKNDSTIAFKRLSDASSSLSQYLGADLSPTSSATSSQGSIIGQRSSPSKRSNTQRRKPNHLVPTHTTASWNNVRNMRDSPEHASPSLSKSGSSSTLTEKNRLGEAVSSVALRRRGTTDGGFVNSQFLYKGSAPPRTSLPPPPIEQHVSSNPFISPRVLVRPPSASRIGPPSAPPSRGLPAPPPKDSPSLPGSDDGTGLRSTSPVSSSSTLSFASAASSARVPLQEAESRKTEWEPDRESSNLRSGGHTVKKSISHQNFTRRPSFSFATGSASSTPIEQGEDKVPRKQRSFHNNSRMILPSLPTPLRQPFPAPSRPQSPPPPSSPDALRSAEQRGGSATSTSVRKRLFSGSSVRRPASQTFSASEDDHQSIFSAEGEQTQTVTITEPVGSAKSPASSFWDDDGPSDLPSSPMTSTSEYTPQMIVSPAEMLRMEACFIEGRDDYDVSGEISFTSTSASILDRNGSDNLSSPVSPTHYIIEQASSTSSGTKRSPAVTGLSSPLRRSLRPSTSQNSMAGTSSLFPSVPSLPSIGLPPPPRPRRQTAINDREATITPLSPAPIRRVNTERRPPVRSILKKPSFLDIEDETHPRRPLSVASAFTGSFLDLDRGRDSFDTIRSQDEQGGPE